MADTKISALTVATTPLAGTEVLPIVQSGVTKQVSVANLTAGRAVSMLSGTATNSFLVGNSTGAKYSRIQSTGNGAQVNLDIWGKTAAGVDAGFSIGIGITGDKGLEFQDNATGVVRAELAQAGDLKLNSGNLIQGTAAKGINFTANSALAGKTSQLLNYYEEGTYTPTISVDTGSVTLDTAFNSLSYTRVGRVVTVTGLISIASVSSPTGYAGVSLPYTSANLSKGASRACGSVSFGGSVSLNVNQINLTLTGNSSIAYFGNVSGSTVAGASMGQQFKAGVEITFTITYIV